jgi:hypothetical protein
VQGVEGGIPYRFGLSVNESAAGRGRGEVLAESGQIGVAFEEPHAPILRRNAAWFKA